MTPKEQIEMALNRAAWSLITEHVVSQYMAEGEPTLKAVPELVKRVAAIYRDA